MRETGPVLPAPTELEVVETRKAEEAAQVPPARRRISKRETGENPENNKMENKATKERAMNTRKRQKPKNIMEKEITADKEQVVRAQKILTIKVAGHMTSKMKTS